MCGASSSFHMPYSSRRFLVRGCTGKTVGMGLFLSILTKSRRVWGLSTFSARWKVTRAY